MAINYLNNIDLNKNQALNLVLQKLATPPSSPVAGQIYYDTTTNKLKYYNGTVWIEVYNSDQIIDTIGNAFIDSNSIDFTYNSGTKQITADVKRKSIGLVAGSEGLINETVNGIVVALGIGDGTRALPGNTPLNQISAPTADVSLNSKKIINLADPVNPTDAANKQYVDSVAQGIDAKQSVRAATTANITLSGTQTIDGVALSVGDRVLVKDQTTASQNGIYVVASGSWSRTTDADSWSELVSAFVWVESGTQNGDTGWLCTVDPGGTLGTTAVTWVQFSGAAQINAGNGLSKTGNTLDVNVDNTTIEIVSDTLRVKDGGIAESKIANGAVNLATKVAGVLPIANGGTGANNATQARANLGCVGKYATTIGDGTNTSYTITHNLGTQDVTVTIYRNSAPYDIVYTDVEITNTNSITVRFAVAPTTNQFRVVITG